MCNGQYFLECSDKFYLQTEFVSVFVNISERIIMNNMSKDKTGQDVLCKSHLSRLDKGEIYRVCPSKLSKRELEDLYFSVLGNNLELKKTVNVQNDKIRVLTTKVQRLTTLQQNMASKENKEGCTNSKVLLNQQKELISDLRLANERLTDRIRHLNMKLCSAKQFLKHSPVVVSARCNRCCATSSIKNSSASALNLKQSDANLGNLKNVAASCQNLNKVTTSRTEETEPEQEEKKEAGSNKTCDENKCRILTEELTQKIVNLQQELSNTHQEYSNRISKLEQEVMDLHQENIRVKSECAASLLHLEEREKKADELITRLRAAETKYTELEIELKIEKGKVLELETRVKAADLSSSVARTIEEHFSNIALEIPVPTKLLKDTLKIDETELSHNADDSGYTDGNKSQQFDDDKGLAKLNRELMNRIADLQTELDTLKIAAAGESKQDDKVRKIEPCPDIRATDKVSLKNVEQYSRVVAEPALIEIDDGSSLKLQGETDSLTSKSIRPTVASEDRKFIEINLNTKENRDIKTTNNRQNTHNAYQPGPHASKNQPKRNATKIENATLKLADSKPDKLNERQSVDHGSYIEENTEDLKKFGNSINNSINRVIDEFGNEGVSRQWVEQSVVDKHLSFEVDNRKDAITEDDISLEVLRDSVQSTKIKLNSTLKSPKHSVEEDGVSMRVHPSSPKFQGENQLRSPRMESNQVQQPRESCGRKNVGLETRSVEVPPGSGKPRCPLATSSPHTYTVQGSDEVSCSRLTSADNTDCEISSIASEDGKSPKVMSPGEQKVTSTYTDSYTAPTNYGSLSEGEVPTYGGRKMAPDEKTVRYTQSSSRKITSSEKMEAALEAITVELTRCRELLQSRRPQEVISRTVT